MPYLLHRKIRFYYEVHGTGTPFVFLHGLGGSLEQPLSVYPPRPGVRVCSLDFPGHGRTRPPGPASRCTFRQLADDVVAWISALRLERPVIGGISMGAAVTLAIACRHQDLAAGFVVVRPAWHNQPNPANLAPLATIARLIGQLGAREAERSFRRSPAFHDLAASSPDTAGSLLRQFRRPQAEPGRRIVADLISDAPYSSNHQLKAITKPVLVVGNQDDPLHPFATAAGLAASIPSATLATVPSKNRSVTGHLRGVRRSLDAFLRAIRRPTPGRSARLAFAPAR